MGSGHLNYWVFVIYVSALYHINVDLPRSCTERKRDASDKQTWFNHSWQLKQLWGPAWLNTWSSLLFPFIFVVYFQIFPVLLSPHPAFFKSWMSVGSLVSRLFLSPIFYEFSVVGWALDNRCLMQTCIVFLIWTVMLSAGYRNDNSWYLTIRRINANMMFLGWFWIVHFVLSSCCYSWVSHANNLNNMSVCLSIYLSVYMGGWGAHKALGAPHKK